jgi:hypothetical protein
MQLLHRNFNCRERIALSLKVGGNAGVTACASEKAIAYADDRSVTGSIRLADQHSIAFLTKRY